MDNLQALKQTGTKIVTNAGGVNPSVCVARMQQIAGEASVDLRIAFVEGDDLLGRINAFADHTEIWGAAATFTGGYAGTERIPALDFAALRDRALADGTAIDGAVVAEQEFTPGLTVTPDVKDRHAANDVGGRIDMTKAWRPSMPDPVATSSAYQQTVAATSAAPAPPASPAPRVAVGDVPATHTVQ